MPGACEEDSHGTLDWAERAASRRGRWNLLLNQEPLSRSDLSESQDLKPKQNRRGKGRARWNRRRKGGEPGRRFGGRRRLRCAGVARGSAFAWEVINGIFSSWQTYPSVRQAASQSNSDVTTSLGLPVGPPRISPEALALWRAAIEQERKGSVYRDPSEDDIPLQLEEFDGLSLEREFWKRAVPLCRQTKGPWTDWVHPEGFDIELRALRVADDLMIGVAEIRIERRYQNLDYLGLRLYGTIRLKSFRPLKTVTRSGLRADYLEPGTRPKWLVPDFKLPDRSNQLKEVLQEAFVAPKGSHLNGSDLFQIFKAPDRLWKKEDLEWTGKKLIMHPVFRIQTGVTPNRAGLWMKNCTIFLRHYSCQLSDRRKQRPLKCPQNASRGLRMNFAREHLRNRSPSGKRN
jgi:hypothetical protein